MIRDGLTPIKRRQVFFFKKEKKEKLKQPSSQDLPHLTGSEFKSFDLSVLLNPSEECSLGHYDQKERHL